VAELAECLLLAYQDFGSNPTVAIFIFLNIIILLGTLSAIAEFLVLVPFSFNIVTNFT